MAILSILAATLAAWVIGAVWYMVLSRPWLTDSGIPTDAAGQPKGRSPAVAFGGGFLCLLVVAGMMRHMLASSGITTPVPGMIAGLGVGLFFIAPWVAMNVLFTGRPLRLALIDGGYPAIGCAAMGLVLALMG